MNRFFSFLILLFFFFTSSLFSWWEPAHLLVARIAYERLHEDVKEKLNNWLETATLPFPGFSSFDKAATLPDVFHEQGLHAFDTWHYSIIPYDPTHFLSPRECAKITATNNGRDVLFAIRQSLTTLRNETASGFTKGWMLFFLAHCTGDIHQPLHTSTYYSASFPRGDRGGNEFIVKVAGHTTNLHCFWDSLCGIVPDDYRSRSLDEKEILLHQWQEEIVSQFPESSLQEKISLDPKEWRKESTALALSAREGLESGASLSKDYIAKGQKIAKERVALAGYRLAFLLNSIPLTDGPAKD